MFTINDARDFSTMMHICIILGALGILMALLVVTFDYDLYFSGILLLICGILFTYTLDGLSEMVLYVLQNLQPF